MRTPCPNQFEGCPDPFADQHHLYKEADANTPLKRVFCNLGANAVQLCRCVHKELEATVGWLPYPDTDVMLDLISSEVEIGNASLSRSARKKIGL